MTLEDYPEDVDIQKTNFKTDQQETAAQTIAEEWPVELDTLAEEGPHVKMFYSQVLDQFLGPAETDMTFSEIESEYGSVSQWAEGEGDAGADVEVPDVEDIEPGGDESAPADTAGATAGGDVGAAVDTPGIDLDEDDVADLAASADAAPGSDDDAGAVDERRRAWFAAGFREGVEFALQNPELFGRE